MSENDKITLFQPRRPMLEKYHDLQSKAKTTDELKVAFQMIWEELPQEHMNIAVANFTQVQWRRCIRARQVKWPGWKIHRPGLSSGSALPSPAYCFALVIVWTENKNVTISDCFICFILMVKRRLWPVFWGRQLKKVVNFFWEKKCIRVTWLKDFWPRNDLARLLRCRRHCPSVWLPTWL